MNYDHYMSNHVGERATVTKEGPLDGIKCLICNEFIVTTTGETDFYLYGDLIHEHWTEKHAEEVK